jgi:hypothetical protein
MSRRALAIAVIGVALLAALVVAIALPVMRTPAFHHYADQRTWLGIAHAGDVLSNLPFVLAGGYFLPRARSLHARLACLGVVAMGITSGAYHVAPGDVGLAFDWGSIALALMLVTAAVIDDRLGGRAGRIAIIIGPLLAITSIVIWYAGGATHGGTVTPYGAVQALGVALPPLLVLIAPGAIPRRPVLLGVLWFAFARLCTANDRQLLDAVGISGHSLKHISAAIAAGFALYALTAPTTSRASRASLSSS